MLFISVFDFVFVDFTFGVVGKRNFLYKHLHVVCLCLYFCFDFPLGVTENKHDLQRNLCFCWGGFVLIFSLGWRKKGGDGKQYL